MEPKVEKKKLTHAQAKKIAYVSRKLFGTIAPATYLIYVSGGFEGNFTTTGVKSIFVVLGLVVGLSFLRDFVNYVKDKRNKDSRSKALGKALLNSVPWLAISGILLGIMAGLASLTTHVLIISAMQLGASASIGFEEYHILEMKKAEDEANVSNAVKTVAAAMNGGASNV